MNVYRLDTRTVAQAHYSPKKAAFEVSDTRQLGSARGMGQETSPTGLRLLAGTVHGVLPAASTSSAAPSTCHETVREGYSVA